MSWDVSARALDRASQLWLSLAQHLRASESCYWNSIDDPGPAEPLEFMGHQNCQIAWGCMEKAVWVVHLWLIERVDGWQDTHEMLLDGASA